MGYRLEKVLAMYLENIKVLLETNSVLNSFKT